MDLSRQDVDHIAHLARLELASDMRRHPHHVPHHGGGIAEHVLVDLLVNIADAGAALAGCAKEDAPSPYPSATPQAVVAVTNQIFPAVVRIDAVAHEHVEKSVVISGDARPPAADPATCAAITERYRERMTENSLTRWQLEIVAPAASLGHGAAPLSSQRPCVISEAALTLRLTIGDSS